MQKRIRMKGLVIGIILLFIGTTIGSTQQDNKVSTDNSKKFNETSINWWPMFGHDPSHSHCSTSKGPDTDRICWSYTINGGMSSPAVVNGKVYVGSYDNKVYCLNASSGGFVWNYTTDGFIETSPAVMNGNVYIGSNGGKVYCLDAISGELIWNYSIGYPTRSPTVADGKVYLGSDHQYVYCLNASSGKLVWKYNTGFMDVSSSPAMADGKIYIGSADGKVYCLDATSGKFEWNYTINDNVWSSPAVFNGMVYVASKHANVSCLNASSGELEWFFGADDDSEMCSSPAVVGGRVYIGTMGGYVYCVNASSGGLVWKCNVTSQIVYSSPMVADGKVYIGGGNQGEIYCLNASNGKRIWTFYTSAEVFASPAVAEGIVYVPSYDGQIYAFGSQPNPSSPTPPNIQGSVNGKIRQVYNYTFNSTDPNYDNIFYYINWGDHTNSSWIGPYLSGVTITRSHVWSKKGIYTIKAKAKNTYGNESDWGALTIKMPYEPPRFSFIHWLLERFPHAFPILRQLLGY